jgi:hypothetical protein
VADAECGEPLAAAIEKWIVPITGYRYARLTNSDANTLAASTTCVSLK